MAIGGSYIPCTSLMDVEVRSSSCGGWGGSFTSPKWVGNLKTMLHEEGVEGSQSLI